MAAAIVALLLVGWSEAVAQEPGSDIDFAQATDEADPFKDDELEVRPRVLREPGELPQPRADEPLLEDSDSIHFMPVDPPLGFTGNSGILPSEAPENSHFIPMEDRWRVGFPEWDRYDKGHPWVDDYPYMEGHWWDPYNQNVLKGDYPIVGNHTFLTFTGTSDSIFEFRQVPTPTTPFESTVDPRSEEFFGNPNQFFYSQYFRLTADLLHGDAAFKPADWRLKITPIFNLNYLNVQELGVVNPNVQEGTTRYRQDFALEEWFAEVKLADLSPDYDFASVRAGSQYFASDFRGFVFSDINRAVRLFGTRNANREQFNVVYFDETEKDTNSLLNTFDDRHQNVLIANYYKQDFIWPGYTSQVSFHFNSEKPSLEFDTNDFPVRPDPVGIFQKHQVDAYYFGWAGDGHINRINVNHAFYYVFGRDGLNPLAGRPIDIDAYMGALELSYDRDWVRFRASAFFASGDEDINDGVGQGFDSILDNPNFAGGEFSYWQRQAIRLFGVNLTNRMSLLPDMRSSKFQGQSNFVNPGLFLTNLGMDFDVTPKTRLISNVNFLWFDETQVLEQFVFQDNIHHYIGADLSLGIEHRPWLSNNAIIIGGVSGLIPGRGFEDLYNPLVGDANGLFTGFLQVALTY